MYRPTSNNFTETDARVSQEPHFIDTSDPPSFMVPPQAEEEIIHVEGRKFVEHHDPYMDIFEYDRPGSDPGLVVIFNQEHFDNDLKPRSGSKRDVNEITRTLGRLGYNIEKQHIHNNRSRKEILDILNELSNEDHSNRNSLIIFFLSHGDENNVIRTKDAEIRTHEIWTPFLPSNCPSLENKPKFFVFQACKGKSFSKSTTSPSTIIPHQIFSTPLEPDILVAFAAVEGSVSYRNSLHGTWFIQEMCRNFNAYGRRDDVVSLLIRTTKCVANNYYHIEEEDKYRNTDELVIRKQMPLFFSTLAKKFYLTKSKDRSFTIHSMKQSKDISKTLKELKEKVDHLYAIHEGDERKPRKSK